MRTYTRALVPGATYLFTVNLAERQDNDLLTRHIYALREAFRLTKQEHPFAIEAMERTGSGLAIKQIQGSKTSPRFLFAVVSSTRNPLFIKPVTL